MNTIYTARSFHEPWRYTRLLKLPKKPRGQLNSYPSCTFPRLTCLDFAFEDKKKRQAYRALSAFPKTANSGWTCLIFCKTRATYMSHTERRCCFLSQSGSTVILREVFRVSHPLLQVRVTSVD